MAESLYRNRGYVLDKDLIPIAITAVVPNVLLVHPKLPFKNVTELIAFGRANPEKLTYCSSGTGTSQHIIAEMFKMETKVSILHIPHKGTAAAMLTFLSGQCDMMFDGMGTASSQIKAGKLRPLAVTTRKRSAQFADIPTMQEAGGPNMDAGTWYALWAPAATPKDIVQKLRREVAKALIAPSIQDAWKLQGAEMSTVTAEQLQTYIQDELTHWTKINQLAGIKLD
jgi:tripartite-type tricarboxylate transporter receptor subunit TctC